MKRYLCAALAILMLLACMAGCKKNEEAPSNESSDVVETTGSDNPYDVYDDLGDLKFGTATSPVNFNVLQWDSYDDDWCIDPESTESTVGRELYERQLYIEDRFGIVFTFEEIGGGHGSSTEINQKVQASIMGGTHTYDLVGHFGTGSSLMVTSGYAHNLLDLEYLNLSKSYWPKDLLNANVVNNQLYFLTGYLAPSYFGNIACVLYNKTMLDNINAQDPVELVDSNQWTFDKLKEMTINMYSDSHNNQTVDREDTFGLVLNMSAAPLDALPIACGVRLMDVGSDGRLQLSPTCYNTKAIGIMDYLTKFVTENSAVWIDDDCGDDFGNIFPNGRSLFLVDQLNRVPVYLEKASFEIGAVPLPKYDTDQEQYYSSVGAQFTMFTVPADAKDPDMSGAILEALEAYSYRELFPVLYEQNFKLRYSENESMSRMVTLIYESACLDPAKTWGDAADIYWTPRASLNGKGDTWTVKLASFRNTTWKGSIDALNKYLFHEN